MNGRSYKLPALLISIIIIAVTAYAVDEHYAGSQPSPLIVYSADAYVQEANDFLGGFHNSTGIAVAPAKGGGSLTDAYQIGQGSPSDVFISVSLASYGKQYLQSRYSGWAVAFASDQMVLAYSNATTSNSYARSVIAEFQNASASNSTSGYNQAFTELTSGKVKIGIANPNSDPAGFRGWLTLEMAGSVFHDNNSSYFTNRISSNGGNVTESNAAQLVAPLEAGNIQFLFIYHSAALVKHLHYIDLPASVNLGSVSYASFYSKFSYSLTDGPVYGAPIYLYITALNGSQNSGNALKFTEYVLNNTELIASYGLTPLSPLQVFNSTVPPQQITSLITSGRAIQAGSI